MGVYNVQEILSGKLPHLVAPSVYEVVHALSCHCNARQKLHPNIEMSNLNALIPTNGCPLPENTEQDEPKLNEAGPHDVQPCLNH